LWCFRWDCLWVILLIKYLLSSVYISFILFILRVYSLFNGFKIFLRGLTLFIEWEVFTLNSVEISLVFLFDWISLSFMGFVLMISSIVFFYRTSYIRGEKYFYRFIVLVYLFVVSIVLLILRPNMLRILLGWDGLGLVSYCLVIFYQNVKSSSAGIITILSNRIGDVAILLRISWLLNFGTWNFYYFHYFYSNPTIFYVLFLVVLAAITKSAQMPFSAWLPAAIAAPTPVSALVHSSTLVTAGVYLLIRFRNLLGESKFLFFIGVFTIFMSGVGANYETDLKKIIALSTLSQLGLIITVLSLGMPEFSFFHLITHAMFKSLLFLCAGSFIHSLGDNQDIRLSGSFVSRLPVTSSYFIGSSLALCGFPFLAGFYSKDLILEYFFIGYINYFICLVVIVRTVATITYSIRLLYYLYFKNFSKVAINSLHEDNTILFPISFLYLISVMCGSIICNTFISVETIVLPLFYKLIILFSIITFGFLIFVLIDFRHLYIRKSSGDWTHFFGLMWFLPFISSVIVYPTLSLGQKFLKNVDQRWVEYYGGLGRISFLQKSSRIIDYINNLNLKSYLLVFMYFVLIFIFFIYFNSLNSKHRIEDSRIV